MRGSKPTSFVYECRGGREIPLRLPMKKTVCPTCEGRGKYVNPSIDANGINPEEFEQDEEFKEAYFSGLYDVTCSECNGSNVVDQIDESKHLTSSQKRRLRAFEAQQQERAEFEREDRVTEYWESGGYSGSRF